MMPATSTSAHCTESARKFGHSAESNRGIGHRRRARAACEPGIDFDVERRAGSPMLPSVVRAKVSGMMAISKRRRAVAAIGYAHAVDRHEPFSTMMRSSESGSLDRDPLALALASGVRDGRGGVDVPVHEWPPRRSLEAQRISRG